MSERIALLVVVLGVALSVAPACRRKAPAPDVEEQLPRSSAVREEVVRGPSGVEVRPELIPLETRAGYVPAEGRPVPAVRSAPLPVPPAGPASERSSRRADPEALKKAIDQVSERASCNPVMGCPAERAVLAAGAEAVAPLIERYGRLERPGYQKFHIIEMLGRIREPAAVPFLLERLSDTHWQARTSAAVALGRMGDPGHLERLQGLLAYGNGGDDAGFRYGLAFAVDKLGGQGGRAILLEALSPDKVGGTNWGYTRVAVEALAELEVKEACPRLPACVDHNDVFLKKEAIRAAAVLGCKEAEVLAALSVQLDSRIPSVRRASREALEALTGARLSSRAQFLEWEKSREQ
jgi:HEAT repeat protein